MADKPKTRQPAAYVSDEIFKIEVFAEPGHVIISIDDQEYELSPESADKTAEVLREKAQKARAGGTDPVPTTPSGHSGTVL